MKQVPAWELKLYNKYQLQLLSTYEFVMTGEDDRLHSFYREEWVDWPGLERSLIKWLTEGVPAGTKIMPDQANVFANGDGLVAVVLEHSLNNYWFLECYPAYCGVLGEITTDLTVVSAPALLRIKGTHDMLELTKEAVKRFIYQPGYPYDWVDSG